jgi:hypothetical protein
MLSIWYCGAGCFLLENASKYFFFQFYLFIFNIIKSKSLKSINVMLFQVKRSFETHPKT